MVLTLDEIAEYEKNLRARQDRERGRTNEPLHPICQEASLPPAPPWMIWMEIGGSESEAYNSPYIKSNQIFKKSGLFKTWQDSKSGVIEATAGRFGNEKRVRDWFVKRRWAMHREKVRDAVHRPKMIGEPEAHVGPLRTEMADANLDSICVYTPNDGTHPPAQDIEVSIPALAPIKLRLLVTTSRGGRYSFSQKVMQLFSKHFDLSVGHLEMLNGSRDATNTVSWGDGKHQSCLSQVHVERNRQGQCLPIIVSRHNLETGATTALLIFHEPPSNKWVEEYEENFASRCNFATDPFLPHVLACIPFVIGNKQDIANIKDEIWQLRTNLGLHAKDYDPLGDDSDFISGVKQIEWMSFRLAGTRDVLHNNIIRLETLERAGSRLAKMKNARLEKLGEIPDAEVSELIGEEGLGGRYQAALYLLDETAEKIAGIQHLVSNYMAIKESRANRELAKASKMLAEAARKDSSAMKSIAVLTMLFLPATAVAAVYDTPFFERAGEDGDGKLVPKDFSDYWIVAVPLTVGIMLLWFIHVWPVAEWFVKVRLMDAACRAWLVERWKIFFPDGSEDSSSSDSSIMGRTTPKRQSVHVEEALPAEAGGRALRMGHPVTHANDTIDKPLDPPSIRGASRESLASSHPSFDTTLYSDIKNLETRQDIEKIQLGNTKQELERKKKAYHKRYGRPRFYSFHRRLERLNRRDSDVELGNVGNRSGTYDSGSDSGSDCSFRRRLQRLNRRDGDVVVGNGGNRSGTDSSGSSSEDENNSLDGSAALDRGIPALTTEDEATGRENSDLNPYHGPTVESDSELEPPTPAQLKG